MHESENCDLAGRARILQENSRILPCPGQYVLFLLLPSLFMEDCIRNLVKKSRSTRRFQEERQISEEILLNLLDIARFCPSGRNRQPIRYILSIDREENARIRTCIQWAMDLPDWEGPEEGENPAAYITMVTEQKCVPDPRYDIGIAAQTILLAAAECGIGGCMIGSIERAALRRILAIPKEFEIHLLLALGYPAETIVLDPLPEVGDTRYWRDAEGVHHVPKRSLAGILLRSR